MTSGRDRGASERRKEQRWPCRVDVAILPLLSEGGFRTARLSDFSDHGIGGIVSLPLRVDEQFMVKIMLQQLTLLAYTVRNCVPDAEGYRFDAEFSHVVGSANENAEIVRASFIWHLEATAAGAGTATIGRSHDGGNA